MAITQDNDMSQFQKTLRKLSDLTTADPYDPFKQLVWPSAITTERPWMSKDLMSIAGTAYEQTLTPAQLLELSKWEFVNFASLNVTGIRELLVEMTGRLHLREFESMSEYMHHIVAEENEHMWYFARLCQDYAGKIYPDRAVSMTAQLEPVVDNFFVFARILIFEEIVDFYNRSMGEDTTLDSFVRTINRLHHLDETRHIAYGRLYLEIAHREVRNACSAERVREVEKMVKGFMKVSTQKLYRPEIYADAGLPTPTKIRKDLLASPARLEFNKKLTAGTAKYFTKVGIFETSDVWEENAA